MSAPTVRGGGNPAAKIMVVTEFATADDLWKQFPLSGKMGEFAWKLLGEAGIPRTSTYVTPVMRFRAQGDDPDLYYSQTKAHAAKHGLTETRHNTWVHPKLVAEIEHLHETIARIKPEVIIAFGDLAMFACAGVFGAVATWRGSNLACVVDANIRVIPTYPAATVIRKWEIKGFVLRDLKRVRNLVDRPDLYTPPVYNTITAPTFPVAKRVLLDLLAVPLSGNRLRIAVDLETIARHISCLGIAWSCRDAICIPFITLNGDFYSEEEEIELHFLLRELLTHPNTEVIGQNFNYDNQHFAKHLGYHPNQTDDTMLAQHALFPGLPKSLDFLSSMYCHYHVYWKDEMDDYSRLPENMEQYWLYNCKDVMATFEVDLVLQELLIYYNKTEQYQFLMEVSRSALQTMHTGCAVDQKARGETAGKLMAVIAQYDELISLIIGRPFNVGSPVQMQKYFYDELRLPRQINRKTKRPSCDDKALETLRQKEPLIIPLVELISKRRSMAVFLKTFCLMPLDIDGRMRCSFNTGGAETFRLSSSSNAFGSGGNLQNIPKGEEKD